ERSPTTRGHPVAACRRIVPRTGADACRRGRAHADAVLGLLPAAATSHRSGPPGPDRCPIVQACLRGEGSLESYVAFLTQAWHHVRHTVPLLTACRDRLPPRLHWLRPAMDEYIDEESGHDAWILSDIAACGI